MKEGERLLREAGDIKDNPNARRNSLKLDELLGRFKRPLKGTR